MKASTGRSPSAGATSFRLLMRGVGRAAIWTALALLLLRGVVADTSVPASEPPGSQAALDQKSAAFAVRFARAYLADPSPSALAPFLAQGAGVGTGRAPVGGELVAQAEVAETEELGGGRALLTVACELRDSRTLYLAVPIARAAAGEVAALGAPSIVAAPGPAGADPERPRPLAGAGASAIRALVARFLPAYVASTAAGDLTYLVAPGHRIDPLGGALRFDSLSGVRQLGSGEGLRRSVLAAARLTDPASGATYPVVYRLELLRGARWYVESVAGDPA